MTDPIEIRIAMQSIAPWVKAYFDELINQGFERHEALELTIAFQHSMIMK